LQVGFALARDTEAFEGVGAFAAREQRFDGSRRRDLLAGDSLRRHCDDDEGEGGDDD